MKYIQCQHCEKKYTANEKLCAAVGKKIRCKHCQQIFEIIIHDNDFQGYQEDLPLSPAEQNTAIDTDKERETPSADDSALRNETADQEELPDSNNEKPEENTEPAKKKFNIPLLISITLGLVLLTMSTVAYLFFYHHDLFQPPQKPDAKHIIPHELIKPLSIPFPQQKHATGSEKPKQKPAQPAPRAQKAKSLLEGPDHPSQVCKDSSADYWFRTRLLVTSQLDTLTYKELLNQNLDQAEEIRRLCKDKLLIARITESAKTGQVPAWIKTEIQSRNRAVETNHE